MEFISDSKSDWCHIFRTIETLSKAKRPPIFAIAVTRELSGSLRMSTIRGEKIIDTSATYEL